MKQDSTKKIYEQIVGLLGPVWGINEARQIARFLLEEQFGWKFTDILADKMVEFPEEQTILLKERTDRLLQQEPLQYVLGKTHFLGRVFRVDKNVLIPRPETEELVMLMKRENELDNPAILDIGTGSGCIAISLALEIPEARVEAWDVKEETLEIARENANNLGASINLQQQNVFETDQIAETFDIIVSNPPYVLESEKEQMLQNVLEFEPHLALFVFDHDPLIFYRKIAGLAKKALPKGGRLYFEINERYGQAVQDLIESLGFKAFLKQDIHGKDRMISAIRS